jgi:hypothetical protein
MGQRPRNRRFDKGDGIEFVCCRICGNYRRVINSQHLSKHDTDRETYMEEYDLSPDELIAKAFRMIQSSRPGYYPNGKNEWIAAMKKVYEKDGKVFAGHLQDKPNIYMNKAYGFLAIGIRRCMPPDLILKKCVSAAYGTKRKSLRKYALCTKSICPSTPHT